MARGLDYIHQDMAGRPGRAVVNMSAFIDLKGLETPEDPYREEDEVCEDGAGGYTNCASAVEHEVDQLIKANIPVVVSANNQNNDHCETSPARMGYSGDPSLPNPYPVYNNIITVGGVMYDTSYNMMRWLCDLTPEGCDPSWVAPDANGTIQNKGSNYGKCVSIYAPSWNVKVAGASGAASYRPAGAASSGTSFAAPQVAGAVARLLQDYPYLSPAQVWNELLTRSSLAYAPDFDPSVVTNSSLLHMPPGD